MKKSHETEGKNEAPGSISSGEGGNIVIEIDEPETSGTVRAGREDKIEKAKEPFEEALNKVLPATKTVVEKLRSVTFGVNLSIMASAVITSASVEANFGVTVRWTGQNKETN